MYTYIDAVRRFIFLCTIVLAFSASRDFYETFCKLSSKLLLRARVSTGRSTQGISVILYPSSSNLSLSLCKIVTRRDHRFNDESTVKKISPSPRLVRIARRPSPFIFITERFHRGRSANYDRSTDHPRSRRISGNRWPSNSYKDEEREREEKKMTRSSIYPRPMINKTPLRGVRVSSNLPE